jgi:PAS domain S-box-containing protein
MHSPMTELSGRENQVVLLAADGLTDKEVAKHLDLQLATIRTYWERIREKLGTSNKSQSISKLLAQLYREKARSEREYEHIMKLVVETVPDFAIFLIEPNGTLRSWNEGVRNVFGYEASEWIGKTADIIFTNADRKTMVLQKELAVAMDIGRANNQRWHQRKDGSKFWGSGFASTVLDEEGNLIGIVKICRDHTLLTGDRKTLSPGDLETDDPDL